MTILNFSTGSFIYTVVVNKKSGVGFFSLQMKTRNKPFNSSKNVLGTKVFLFFHSSTCLSVFCLEDERHLLNLQLLFPCYRQDEQGQRQKEGEFQSSVIF